MDEFVENFNEFKNWLYKLSSKDIWGEEYNDNIAVGFDCCVEHIKAKFEELDLKNAF